MVGERTRLGDDAFGVTRGRCRCGRCDAFVRYESRTKIIAQLKCAVCGCPSHRHVRRRGSLNRTPLERVLHLEQKLRSSVDSKRTPAASEENEESSESSPDSKATFSFRYSTDKSEESPVNCPETGTPPREASPGQLSSFADRPPSPPPPPQQQQHDTTDDVTSALSNLRKARKEIEELSKTFTACFQSQNSTAKSPRISSDSEDAAPRTSSIPNNPPSPSISSVSTALAMIDALKKDAKYVAEFSFDDSSAHGIAKAAALVSLGLCDQAKRCVEDLSAVESSALKQHGLAVAAKIAQHNRYLTLAKRSISTSKADLAAQSAKKALAVSPWCAASLVLLAKSTFASGSIEACVDMCKSSGKILEQRKAAVSKASFFAPEYAAAAASSIIQLAKIRASALAHMCRLDEASNALREAGLNDERARIDSVRSVKREGNHMFRKGSFYKACKKYTSALELVRPSNCRLRALLHCNRAAAKIAMGLAVDAIEDCSAALQLCPGYMKARIRRARAAFATGLTTRIKDALQDYKDALKSTQNSEPWMGRTLSKGEIQQEMQNVVRRMQEKEKEKRRRRASFEKRRYKKNFPSFGQSKPGRPQSSRSRSRRKPAKKSPAANLYSALGIRDTLASPGCIKRSFRKLALKYHPDKDRSQSDAERKRNLEKFKAASEAYAALSDPVSRAAYDFKLKRER